MIVIFSCVKSPVSRSCGPKGEEIDAPKKVIKKDVFELLSCLGAGWVPDRVSLSSETQQRAENSYMRIEKKRNEK